MFGSVKKSCEPKVTYSVVQDVLTEVLSLEDVKVFLGIDFIDFDDLLELIISGVREEAENYTGLSLGERIIQLSGDYKDEKAYMPFEPYEPYSETGLQKVGYSASTLPNNIRLALLNMVQIAYINRGSDLSFNSGLELLAKSRRRVGL